jgi:hypothetical protein
MCPKCGGRLQERGCGACFGRVLEADRGVRMPKPHARVTWTHKVFGFVPESKGAK